jgi:U4/U6 small nuclear ribonucleoprotein PRP31
VNVGVAGKSVELHVGWISQTNFVLKTPIGLRRKVSRYLANKVVLVARMDCQKESRDGQMGRDMAKDVDDKINLWLQPPPTVTKKALPTPLEPPKRRRGGRRYRKEKERMSMTELAKQRNRLAFGAAPLTDDYTGTELGMVGIEGGRLKVTARDTQKLSKRLSKSMQKRLNATSSNSNPFSAP